MDMGVCGNIAVEHRMCRREVSATVQYGVHGSRLRKGAFLWRNGADIWK